MQPKTPITNKDMLKALSSIKERMEELYKLKSQNQRSRIFAAGENDKEHWEALEYADSVVQRNQIECLDKWFTLTKNINFEHIDFENQL